jgi:hypothetical protein
MRSHRTLEPGPQPSGAAGAGLGRLEVAVEVVHTEQLQLHSSGDGRRLDLLLRLLGPGRQTQQRNKKSGREGGRSGKQVAAVSESHGAKI